MNETLAAPPVVLGRKPLTIDDVVRVGRFRAPVQLPHDDVELLKKIERSVECIQSAVKERRTVYGINTGFGGMSGVQIPPKSTQELQENLIWFLKTGAGGPLPNEDVRGAMLLRANSFLFAASGVRWELISRIERFLNEGVTPVVREFGSIGASGDLVPLASIAGALTGLGDQFQVCVSGDENAPERQPRKATDVLRQLGLEPIRLLPKEGLAMVNGTSMSTAMAATCCYDAGVLFAVSMSTHALMVQSLNGMEESFAEYIHELKPHPGQLWAARHMRTLLKDSKLVSQTQSGTHHQVDEEERILRRLARNPKARHWIAELFNELQRSGSRASSAQTTALLSKVASAVRDDRIPESFDVEPIQDRYSVRCLPQFIGPIRDGLLTLTGQIEQEMNSATDNPLIDAESGRTFHGGNFLGQYTAVAMDQLRYYIGLLAKHLDAQISLLVTPEFSDGLPPSLIGNPDRPVNMGLKGLQISGNSIMPILSFLGNSIADRFPTHAEQFNQNISSQSFASAKLARQSVDTFRQYSAIALMFALQAVDLRTRLVSGETTYDPRTYLSSPTCRLYEAVREVVGKPIMQDKPYVFDDDESALDEDIASIVGDLAHGQAGRIGQAIGDIGIA